MYKRIGRQSLSLEDDIDPADSGPIAGDSRLVMEDGDIYDDDDRCILIDPGTEAEMPDLSAAHSRGEDRVVFPGRFFFNTEIHFFGSQHKRMIEHSF